MDLNVFKVPIGFLKFCGIWIPKDSSQIYKTYAYFMQILFLYIWSLMMGAAVFYQKNLIDLSSALTFFFTYFVCVIKCVNLIFKIDKFLLLIEDVKKAIKNYGLTEIYIEKHLSFGKKLFLAYWMPVVVTVGIGAIKPYIILKISYQMWFPYDPSIENSVFLFYLSATYQSVETLLYSTANVMIDTVSFIVMVYLVAMLEHLCDKLENLKRHKLINLDGSINKKKKIDNYKELLKCVNYQRTIEKLVRETERIFSKVIAVQGSFMAIILCPVIYALSIMTFPDDFMAMLTFFTYTMAMISQISIPCYYGAKISFAFDEISYSAFYSDWFYEDQKYRKDFKFIMQNATRQFKLTAFGLYKINLQTFGKVLNMAYSLYAVVKRVNK